VEQLPNQTLNKLFHVEHFSNFKKSFYKGVFSKKRFGNKSISFVLARALGRTIKVYGQIVPRGTIYFFKLK